MITVTLFKRDGRIVKVRGNGHSGLAQSGNDVLCAAVSALIQGAYLGIKDIAGNTAYVRDDDTGLFEFTVPDGNAHDIDVILRAMYVALQDLSGGYPQNLKLEEA